MRVNDRRAMRVFAEHLATVRRGDGSAIDELCRERPDLADSLRELARGRAEVKVPEPLVTNGGGKLTGRMFRSTWLGRAPQAKSRYALLGEIARGGSTVLLYVWDTVLERPLALKMLDPEALPEDSQAADEERARLLTEARITAALQHPGVVPVHDLGVDEHGRPYFTMPLFDGCTFEEAFDRARSRSGDWSPSRALLALARVCDVVAFAHACGVVHRDLKPANLIARSFDEIYVADWGLAKFVDSAAPDNASAPARSVGSPEPGGTIEGTVAGTPPYMAPEQAEGRTNDVSYPADAYAIGAMLYRLLAGRAPYAPREGTEEPAKTVELIRRGAPTPLRRIAPDAPAELVAISERAMARKPGDRYASIEELGRDLRAVVEKSPEEVAKA